MFLKDVSVYYERVIAAFVSLCEVTTVGDEVAFGGHGILVKGANQGMKRVLMRQEKLR
jgi:hypothetical protein